MLMMFLATRRREFVELLRSRRKYVLFLRIKYIFKNVRFTFINTIYSYFACIEMDLSVNNITKFKENV